MKRLLVLALLQVIVTSMVAQETKWYYGLYRNHQGKEIVILNQNLVFLNGDDYTTFCNYSEETPIILSVYDELDMESGVFVLDKDKKTASLTYDFEVDYNPDTKSDVYRVRDDSNMDVYVRIDGLTTRTMDKVRLAKDKRAAELSKRKEQLIEIISNNSWLMGVWKSSSGNHIIAVSRSGIIDFAKSSDGRVFPDEIFIPGNQISSNEDGEIVICPPAPSEDMFYINPRKKTLRSDFGGSFKKIDM